METGCATVLYDANPQGWEGVEAEAAANTWVTIMGMDVVRSGECVGGNGQGEGGREGVEVVRWGGCVGEVGRQGRGGQKGEWGGWEAGWTREEGGRGAEGEGWASASPPCLTCVPPPPLAPPWPGVPRSGRHRGGRQLWAPAFPGPAPAQPRGQHAAAQEGQQGAVCVCGRERVWWRVGARGGGGAVSWLQL